MKFPNHIELCGNELLLKKKHTQQIVPLLNFDTMTMANNKHLNNTLVFSISSKLKLVFMLILFYCLTVTFFSNEKKKIQ